MSSKDINDPVLVTQILNARSLRDKLWSDVHRPRYHFLPPEGYFNDANGVMYWNGRYHLFYLGKILIRGTDGEESWGGTWDHSSSHDLVHWIHHPSAIHPKQDGSTPRGIYSGGAVRNAPQPTLIYHVPNQGICISTSNDPYLIKWDEHPANPVIPEVFDEEYVVFDPCGWYENGVYYALVGNKSRRPGYEGDCTSLFVSEDLVRWEYRGPFYRSSRKWTDEIEDCACPDFFPLGDKFMLLMHGHKPYGQVHYYLGQLKNEEYFPETHGRMNWPGGQISGPETLLDENERRVFFGWIREARDWEPYGWASTMSIPRILSLAHNGQLRIEPATELEPLRVKHQRQSNIEIMDGQLTSIPNMIGDCIELDLTVDMGTATQFSIIVRMTPNGEEATPIVVCRQSNTIRIELGKSTLDTQISYENPVEPNTGKFACLDAQEAPFFLEQNENLNLRIFIDRSVLEVFANSRQCLTQRIYPTRSDSHYLALLCKGGTAVVKNLDKWDMLPTSPF